MSYDTDSPIKYKMNKKQREILESSIKHLSRCKNKLNQLRKNVDYKNKLLYEKSKGMKGKTEFIDKNYDYKAEHMSNVLANFINQISDLDKKINKRIKK